MKNRPGDPPEALWRRLGCPRGPRGDFGSEKLFLWNPPTPYPHAICDTFVGLDLPVKNKRKKRTCDPIAICEGLATSGKKRLVRWTPPGPSQGIHFWCFFWCENSLLFWLISGSILEWCWDHFPIQNEPKNESEAKKACFWKWVFRVSESSIFKV